MANVHEAVQNLRNQAIALLLDERGKIDDQLKQLGHNNGNAPKRRGRKPKEPTQQIEPVQP